jgi:hypothetical protein
VDHETRAPRQLGIVGAMRRRQSHRSPAMIHFRDVTMCPVSHRFAASAVFFAASRGARHAAWL